jgi:hypothetical protein
VKGIAVHLAATEASSALEMVFDAHDRAFALFKGTCGRGIYDNIRPRWRRFNRAEGTLVLFGDYF